MCPVQTDQSHVEVHPDACNREGAVLHRGSEGRLAAVSVLVTQRTELGSEARSKRVKCGADGFPFR